MIDRKAYWDDSYRRYWMERVAESGTAGASEVIEGDPKTEGDDVYDRVFDTVVPTRGPSLDVGCAWGRMFPLYLKRGLTITGVDISSAMIEAATRRWGQSSGVDRLLEAEAESLPFSDGVFCNVFCLAVFDATDQPRTLKELLRVLRPGGLLYLTGKNTCFADDDAAALAAEEGARSKGHPNFFTDCPAMERELTEHGHEIVKAYYFPRRGDFAAFAYRDRPPPSFYEYFLVIRRGRIVEDFSCFASAWSHTWTARHSP